MTSANKTRIHRSTYAAFAIALLLVIVVNCGGDHSSLSEVDLGLVWPTKFGWPNYYAQRNHSFFEPAQQKDCWRVDQADEWNFTLLAANVGIGLLLATVVAAGWEWRRRYRLHALHLSLADIFLVTALIGATCVWGLSLYDDSRADQRFSHAFTAEFWHEYSASGDVPFDWFWETTGVSSDNQPRRRDFIKLGTDDRFGVLVVPPQAMQALGDARYVKQMYFYRLGFSPDAWQTATWGQLETLTLCHCDLQNEHWQTLPILPRLHQFTITGGEFSDVPLTDKLSRFPALTHLQIESPTNFRGHSLAAMQQLHYLSLSEVALDNETIVQIGKLENLRHLEIDLSNGGASPTDWQPLARLENLDSIGIHCVSAENVSFDSRALAYLSKLPRLKTVHLRIHSNITDDGLAILKEFPALDSLIISCKNPGQFTEAGIDHLTEFAKLRRPTTMRVTIAGTSLHPAYQRLKQAFPGLFSFPWALQDEDPTAVENASAIENP